MSGERLCVAVELVFLDGGSVCLEGKRASEADRVFVAAERASVPMEQLFLEKNRIPRQRNALSISGNEMSRCRNGVSRAERTACHGKQDVVLRELAPNEWHARPMLGNAHTGTRTTRQPRGNRECA